MNSVGRWGALLLLLLLPGLQLAARGEGDPRALPVELTHDNFTSYLRELPETRWCLIEFYAHWCGACKHFQPEYEKLAAFFYKRGELQPKIVVARVDCANEGELCGQFKVESYPTLKLGLAPDFAAYKLDSLTPYNHLRRSFAKVVSFIEEQLDVKLEVEKLESAKSGGEYVEAHVHSGPTRRDPKQADLQDIEGATLKWWEYTLAIPPLLEGLESRQALLDWVSLLAAHHPVKSCQEGAQALTDEFEALWPVEASRPAPAIYKKNICRGGRFRGWSSCQGSTPTTRGYSCGLWQLLHALAARMPEEAPNSGALWMTTAKGFIKHFFQCSECSKHYVEYASSEEALKVQTKKEAVIWGWIAHNKVNGRLAEEEREHPEVADKEWPHLIWPTVQQCPTCRKSDAMLGPKGEIPDWDSEEMYRFLLQYYNVSSQGLGEFGLRGLLRTRTKHASWAEASLVCGVVGVVVFLILRGSSQYRLRKTRSRLL